MGPLSQHIYLHRLQQGENAQSLLEGGGRGGELISGLGWLGNDTEYEREQKQIWDPPLFRFLYLPLERQEVSVALVMMLS